MHWDDSCGLYVPFFFWLGLFFLLWSFFSFLIALLFGLLLLLVCRLAEIEFWQLHGLRSHTVETVCHSIEGNRLSSEMDVGPVLMLEFVHLTLLAVDREVDDSLFLELDPFLIDDVINLLVGVENEEGLPHVFAFGVVLDVLTVCFKRYDLTAW